ncbi:MAG: LysR family transcriptional regulator [Casimicrobiaceae bacterium]
MKIVQNQATPLARLAWTDFHTVLIVARHASVAKASAALAVTHATLLRRLAAIETRIGARLFDRAKGRYSLTAAGEEVERAAAGFEPVARDAELRVLGQDLRPSGHVRVAVAGIVIDHLLPPVLSQFANAYPLVSIELVASRDHVSLTRREADVAIRVADTVSDWLVGRRLAQLRFRVYTLKRPGLRVTRRDPSELTGQRRWIGFERDARDLKFDRWLESHVPESSVVLRVDSFSHAVTMVRAGLGIALLPEFLEADCPFLQPLTAPIVELATPLWLVTHQELRNTTRVKVLMQAVGPALAHALGA